jgi:hypothetical protein
MNKRNRGIQNGGLAQQETGALKSVALNPMKAALEISLKNSDLLPKALKKEGLSAGV